jgi:hypothetical protein
MFSLERFGYGALSIHLSTSGTGLVWIDPRVAFGLENEY